MPDGLCIWCVWPSSLALMPSLSTPLLSVAGAVAFCFLRLSPLPLRVRRLPFREPGAPGLLYQAFARSALTPLYYFADFAG